MTTDPGCSHNLEDPQAAPAPACNCGFHNHVTVSILTPHIILPTTPHSHEALESLTKHPSSQMHGRLQQIIPPMLDSQTCFACDIPYSTRLTAKRFRASEINDVPHAAPTATAAMTATLSHDRKSHMIMKRSYRSAHGSVDRIGVADGNEGCTLK